jgi:phytoene dehydrogenase-like protein
MGQVMSPETGEVREGVWAYVEGGMGSISNALKARAEQKGVQFFTNNTIEHLGLAASGGKVITTSHTDNPASSHRNQFVAKKCAVSNLSPYHLYQHILDPSLVDPKILAQIQHADYSCGAFKINMVVDRLPDFSILPNDGSGRVQDHHKTTIHFESRIDEILRAGEEGNKGMIPSQPVIEMTIPSSLDPTLVPPEKRGQHHIVQLFCQYAPFKPRWEGRPEGEGDVWTDRDRQVFFERVMQSIERHVPGFSSTILHADILAPTDLERVFQLPQGNIFHGSLSLDQLFYLRPFKQHSYHRMSVDGLYLCGSGSHPGGGVTGANGRNCAQVILNDLR